MPRKPTPSRVPATPKPPDDVAPTPNGRTEDERLLETPTKAPQPIDFTHTDPWRIMRMTGEFVEGFDRLAHIGPAVSVFGSARATEDHPDYAAAREIGRLLAKHGFAVVTAAAPGSWRRRTAAAKRAA